MRAVLTMTTDGRTALLERTLESIRDNVPFYDIEGVVIANDAGTEDTPPYLAFAENTLSAPLCSTQFFRRQGFAANLRQAWKVGLDHVPHATHVLHVEDDFTFNAPVDLHLMDRILGSSPFLAQLALKRQPVNDEERAAGGFMQTHPREAWTERGFYTGTLLNFTTNPSLIPRKVIDLLLGQPEPLTEPEMTRILLAEGYHFGYLGRYDDPPLVTHIGDYRSEGWAQ